MLLIRRRVCHTAALNIIWLGLLLLVVVALVLHVKDLICLGHVCLVVRGWTAHSVGVDQRHWHSVLNLRILPRDAIVWILRGGQAIRHLRLIFRLIYRGLHITVGVASQNIIVGHGQRIDGVLLSICEVHSSCMTYHTHISNFRLIVILMIPIELALWNLIDLYMCFVFGLDVYLRFIDIIKVFLSILCDDWLLFPHLFKYLLFFLLVSR